LEQYEKKATNIQDINNFTAEGLLFTQSAEAEVKLSIAHGLVKRDPTRDKRVIEFCMSLPEEQLVQQGIDRNLIRRAMKGILPDLLRLNNKVRGVQSADWIQRMAPHWQEIESEFNEALEERHIKKYINTELARELFYAQHDGKFENLSDKMQMVLIVIAWKRFIQAN
jgi:asparagine synthase (glutamine-hydrolysing)